MTSCLKAKTPFHWRKRKRVIFMCSPIPPAQDISGDPSCLGVLTSVSPYSPRLPGQHYPNGWKRISSTVTAAGQRRIRTGFPKACFVGFLRYYIDT
jgi:hypothetical protein